MKTPTILTVTFLAFSNHFAFGELRNLESLAPELPSGLSMSPLEVRTQSENMGMIVGGVSRQDDDFAKVVDANLVIYVYPTEAEAKAFYQENTGVNPEHQFAPEGGPIGDACKLTLFSPKPIAHAIHSLRDNMVVRIVGQISPKDSEEIVRRVDNVIEKEGVAAFKGVINDALPEPEPVKPKEPKKREMFRYVAPLPDFLQEVGEGLELERCFFRDDVSLTFKHPDSPEDRNAPERMDLYLSFEVFGTLEDAEKGYTRSIQTSSIAPFRPDTTSFGDSCQFYSRTGAIRTHLTLKFRRDQVVVYAHCDGRLGETFIKKMEKLDKFLAETSADEVAAIIVKHTVKPEPKPPRELSKRELRTPDEMLAILKDPNISSNTRATAISDIAERELGDDTEKVGEALLKVAKFDRVIMNRVLAVKSLGEIGWEEAAPYLQSLIDAGAPGSIDPRAPDFEEIRLKRKGALSALVKLEGLEKHQALLESLANDPDESQDIRNIARGWLGDIRE